jgi:lipopolysaccharide transport system permease protein
MSVETLIKPVGTVEGLNFRELWAYRDLLFFLVWRDVAVRYKQTILGVAWIVLQPLVTSIIFSIIFGNFARMPSDNLPYAIFVMAGLTPWNFFASSLTRGSGSVVSSANLISKVYFPRLIIPIAGILAGTVDLGVVLLTLFGLMIFFAVPVTFSALWLVPLTLALAFGLALGASLWLSALNVQYRDVNYVTPVLAQIWLYATPVIYASSLIPEQWRWVYALNPMVGVIDGFRWALFGKGELPVVALGVSFVWLMLMLIGGVIFFKRTEDIFADVV